MDFEQQIARRRRATPAGQAREILVEVADWMCTDTSIDGHAFVKEQVESMMADPDFHALLAWQEAMESPEPTHCAYLSTAFAASAILAEQAGEVSEAWTYVLQARYYADGTQAVDMSQSALIHYKSMTVMKGAAAKKANDPKAAAKAEALGLWMERHAGKHPKLGTVEQYATEVMRRWPVLESSKVICGWSAKWTKAVQKGETPAC